jgi:hypothetical protein
LSVFRESVDELKVSFKSNKNIGYITWRRVYIYDISVNYS